MAIVISTRARIPRRAVLLAARSREPPIMPATVLVFRDQHQKEIQNYAIVGQTLWNFAPQHTEKIPLSELDLAATTKANDDRGVTFRVPYQQRSPINAYGLSPPRSPLTARFRLSLHPTAHSRQ